MVVFFGIYPLFTQRCFTFLPLHAIIFLPVPKGAVYLRQFIEELKDFRIKGDWTLLILCLVTAGVGVICMTSATSAPKFEGNTKYILIQMAAVMLGCIAYMIVSSVDIEVMSERRSWLVAFNICLLLLLIPFGTDNNTGNRSWLDIPLLPLSIQPAEFCKITYIIIMASVMSSHQNDISSVPSVIHMVVHLGVIVGLNMVLSGDAGVSLIFVFIFIGMAFAGGVSLWWFLLAICAIGVLIPVAWPMLGTYQQERIMVLIDPSFDKEGLGARYHSKINLMSLTGGGLTGQGLFNGNRTQGGNLFAQHTDYIFSSIGEELGFFGCCGVMLLEFLIIARCIQVGSRCPDYMRRLVCYGVASSMMFQLMINIGMCIGVMPVIGLTLPFISYGGSSVMSIFAMMGLVSGAHARPQAMSYQRYIQPLRSYGMNK